jgi:zinc D-Ala-D-Ala carboxypeptidase
MPTSFYKHYSDVNPLHWTWPNFTPKEIACKGTGELLVDFVAMDCLQELRGIVGVPVTLNSAYRSVKHNKAIGGAPASWHLKGRAFDIQLTNRLTRDMIHKAAKRAGFLTVLDYDTFCHIDNRPEPIYRDYRSKK